MADGQQKDVIADNERSLSRLTRAIALSGGQFSLVVACCNYQVLQERILLQLQEECLPGYNLRRVILPTNTISLYRAIHSELAVESCNSTQALMVLGLESVSGLDDLLRSINNIRDEFRKHHPFPMVLWVTDEVLRSLRRYAPDFASWAATPIRFFMLFDDLLLFLRQETDMLFTKILQVGAVGKQENQGEFHSVSHTLEKVREDFTELHCAIGELLSGGVNLERDLEASLDFVFGIDDYVADRIDKALKFFHKSLRYWQSESENNLVSREQDASFVNSYQQLLVGKTFSRELDFINSHTSPLLRQGVLEFYIGLCYCRLADRNTSQQKNYWELASSYLKDCLDTFEAAQRPDLVAQFLGRRLEVLENLGTWSELQSLAKKSLDLHQIYGNHLQVACDYGFLTAVAIESQRWSQAAQFARVALWKLYEANVNGDFSNGVFPLLLAQIYRLLLAKALRNLGDTNIAQEHLKTASSELQADLENSDHCHDAYRYIRLLQKLRSLYFAEGRYLEAFCIRQKRRSVEQQYGLRAFIGAGRLQPERQATSPALVSTQGGGKVALEIIASGRQEDINKLIARISRTDQKLMIIHGQSGVGKSSTVTAGLVPALQNHPIGDQIAMPVVQQVYTDWVRELWLSVVKANIYNQDIKQDVSYSNTFATKELILEKIQENASNHVITVLIFDQFEEFFLNCNDRDNLEDFDKFLCAALNIAFVKVIFSLREDYLHKLLEFKHLAKLETINNNILDQSIRYQLTNFSEQDAKKIIKRLTERSQVTLEPALIDALVSDLASEQDGVRPIELQVVGAQLQEERITTLEKYQPYRPNKLIERYIRQLIKDCGPENEYAALFVLYLLTDENNQRPFKTRAELTRDLANLEEVKKLELVLEILVRSGLVVLFPDVPERYQLIHDYLVDLIRYLQQSSGNLQQQLKQLRNIVEQKEAEISRINSELRQTKKQSTLLETHPQEGLNLVTELKELRKREEVAQVEIARLTAELEQQNLQGKLKTSEAKITKRNRYLQLALLFSIGLIFSLFYALRQSAISEITAISATSEALFALDKDIDALKEALQAARKMQTQLLPDATTQEKTKTVLYQATYGMRERNRLLGHSGSVNSVAYSSDGKTIATASTDGTIILWNSRGRRLKVLKGHTKRVTSVAFSPDGNSIVSGSNDKTIKLWKLNGKLILTLKEHSDTVNSVSFSPDSKIIASASTDGTIKLWQRDGKLITTIPDSSSGKKTAAISIAWSPDGSMIAYGSSDYTVKIRSRDGKLLHTLTGHDNSVLSVAWSSNSQTIASASLDNTIKLWHRDGKFIKNLSGHKDGVTSIAFSPDNATIASASIDDTVKIWSIDGRLLDTFRGHNDWVNSISFSPDSRTLASASEDSSAKLWRVQDSPLRKFSDDNSNVTSLTFSPNGKLLASASQNGIVRIWGRDSGKKLQTLKSEQDEVWDIRFSPDGMILAAGGGKPNQNGTINLWNQDGKLLKKLVGHTDVVLGVAWSPDGNILASASKDKTVKIWSREGQLLKTLPNHKDIVNWVAWSSDGDFLASASDDETVKIWSRDAQLVKTLEGHKGKVYGVTWSPNGEIASASIDGSVKIWNRNGQRLQNLNSNGDGFTSVAFNNNGKILAATSDENVKLWDSSGQLIIMLKGYRQGLNNITFSPDGKTLAFGGDKGAVFLQDLDELELDNLLNRGCGLLQDYLSGNSATVSDRRLCSKR